jgi:hypothetical protein
MTAKRFCTLLLAAAALAANPAAALDDLTGQYSGRFSCETTTPSENAKDTFDSTLYLDDAGAGNAFAYINNTLLYFRLAVVSAPEKPDQGRVGGPDCNVSPSNGGSFVQAVVKSKSGSDKASLKGEFVTTRVGGSPHVVQVCRFNLKRETTTLPTPIPNCPL